MSVAHEAASADGVKIPRLDIELSPSCDHACSHCYNVWNASEGDPQAGYDLRGQLATVAFKRLITKAITQSGATSLTITGGEPLLRKDALDLVEHCTKLAPNVSLITNGSHVPPSTAKRLAELGVTQVQLTLLAGDREKHDRLKNAECFDDTVRAALDLREAGVHVVCCFVAMAENEGELPRVLELCAVLGIRHLSYNRMSPTGWAVHHVDRLLPTVAAVEADLETLETLGRAWGIAASTAMPIPPCLVRWERTPWVRFGTCSTGSPSPNVVLDGKGNVRSCNLSSTVLGNLVAQDWADFWPAPYVQSFPKVLPEVCRACAYATTCQGGCKESGFATTGSHALPEPFLAAVLRG